MKSLLRNVALTLLCAICLSSCSDNDVRLLYWNIQNGMWSDQANNYDNFVEWVKGFDADVCVWCEAQTLYYDGTYDSDPDGWKRLPEGWDELARRYGHNYSAIGGVCSGYPQVITSKYPIETVATMTEADTDRGHLCHGSAIQRIVIRGREINFVPLHLAPFANMEPFRCQEMNWILDHSVLDSTYAGHGNWIMLGDFNSLSRVDNFHYQFPADTIRFNCQDVMISRSGLVDILSATHPGEFIPTCTGNRRLDYVYVSPDIKVKSAEPQTDFWCEYEQVAAIPDFWLPSDHIPVLMDFKAK